MDRIIAKSHPSSQTAQSLGSAAADTGIWITAVNTGTPKMLAELI
jgi:hypothetical protein